MAEEDEYESVYYAFLQELERLYMSARKVHAQYLDRSDAEIFCFLRDHSEELQHARERARLMAVSRLQEMENAYRSIHTHREVLRLDELYRTKLDVYKTRRYLDSQKRASRPHPYLSRSRPSQDASLTYVAARPIPDTVVVLSLANASEQVSSEEVPEREEESAEEFCFCASSLNEGSVETCDHCLKTMHSKCLLKAFHSSQSVRCPYCRVDIERMARTRRRRQTLS